MLLEVHHIFNYPLRLFLAVYFLFPASLFSQSTGTSSREEKVIPVIELTGDSYNQGLQHGRQLKKEINEVFSKWKSNIRLAVKADPDSTLDAFIQATDFMTVTKKETPWILDELQGIADGSGQSFNDVYAFQLIDEFWVYLDRQFNTANHHCSGMGVAARPGKPAFIAQNVDLENYMHGYQVLLHLPQNDRHPEQYILSCAGLVALGGMNGEGIALCMNTIMELQASTTGLPVAFIVRAVLSRRNGAEALQFLKTVPHASGQNYILGIKDSVYDFEASANQVVRFIPNESDPSLVYHTNHALANHDVKDWYKEYHQKALANNSVGANSVIRYASLQQRLSTGSIGITPDMVKSTLKAKDDPRHPVCRVYTAGGRGFTFSAVLYTLGGRRSVQVTYGSPDQSSFREHYFKPTGH